MKRLVYGSYIMTCDLCPREVLDLKGTVEALLYKADNGWSYKIVDGKLYTDVCPVCLKGGSQ